MKAKNIDAPTQPPVQDWSDVTAELDQGDFMSLDNDGPSHFTTWLTTINADGSPHVTAVGAVWDDVARVTEIWARRKPALWGRLLAECGLFALERPLKAALGEQSRSGGARVDGSGVVGNVGIADGQRCRPPVAAMSDGRPR
jgi:hypothetical protein